MYRSGNDRLIKGSWLTARTHTGFVAGSFGHGTEQLYCATGTATRYIRAYDKISGRWSSRLAIRTGYIHP